MKRVILRLVMLNVIFVTVFFNSACTNKNSSLESAKRLYVEDAEPGDDKDDIPSISGEHKMFSGSPGQVVARDVSGVYDTDYTGLNPCTDYDGDGIPNDYEVISNPFVADYPKIVTRISGPITLEIRRSEIDHTLNYTEIIDNSEVKNTINNSMEDREYDQLNNKTTPYVTKEEYSMSEYSMDAFGYEDTHSETTSGGGGIVVQVSSSTTHSETHSENEKIEDAFNKSTMSEKTVFEDVEYIDNMDREGIEYKDSTVEDITKKYRSKDVSKKSYSCGPNDGFVRGALYLKNVTVNTPAKISNVKCTLSFRTSAGVILPVKTFYLRNRDYTRFEAEVYGNTELGPYVIEVRNLNTHEVKQALANGYMPQIHVVSYSMTPVHDSNYYPGVDNLKIVKETAKARTATIRISAKNIREVYKVAAFDVKDTSDDNSDNGVLQPGVTLKKALFRILKNMSDTRDNWYVDNDGNYLTVYDTKAVDALTQDVYGPKWLTGLSSHKYGAFAEDGTYYESALNVSGNNWTNFSTYVKSYDIQDGYNTDGTASYTTKYIETIKRIGSYEKYNPFNEEDNPSYDPNERLSNDQFYSMKYWVILHNGKYFEGDLNDPIWVGDRYEIIFVETEDFTQHQGRFQYTPIQSAGTIQLNTRWNRLSNQNEFDRSVYLGRVAEGDVVKVEVSLKDSRRLFDPESSKNEFGMYREFYTDSTTKTYPGMVWYDFNYTFDDGQTGAANGMPKEFTYQVWSAVNSLRLKINESENASSYTVSLRSTPGGDPLHQRTYSAEKVKENNGYVFFTRNINDDPGISDNDSIALGTYYIDVLAHNNVYDVSINKKGSGPEQVGVFGPDGSNGPETFMYRVSGHENLVKVEIDEYSSSNNAEYYLVEVHGPYNYGYDNQNVPVLKTVGHAGLNLLEVPNCIFGPDDLSSDEKGLLDPGVYNVKVYAINNNTSEEYVDEGTGNPTQPVNNDAYVHVTYERNREQKDVQPAQCAALLEPDDVDLEVNFNDGSGWFRLRLSNSDTANLNKTLDCRYTANIDEKNQKMTIFFTPPTGPQSDSTIQVQNDYYNVFRGGADSVDVYVRTVARPEFRDTLWLRPNRQSSIAAVPDSYENMPETHVDPNDLAGLHYIYINDLVTYGYGYDPYLYWINNEYTDASCFDDIQSRTKKDFNEIGSIADHSYGFVNIDSSQTDFMNRFFFSPVEKHTYEVSARIADAEEFNISAMMTEGIDKPNHPDEASFRVLAGNRSIIVRDIKSTYAEKNVIYVKEDATEKDKQNFYTWDYYVVDSEETTKTIYSATASQQTIENWWDSSVTYTVAVVGYNTRKISAGGSDTISENVVSSPVFKKITVKPLVVKVNLEKPTDYYYGYGTFNVNLQNSGYGRRICTNTGIYLDQLALDDNTFPFNIFDSGTNIAEISIPDYYTDLSNVLLSESKYLRFFSNDRCLFIANEETGYTPRYIPQLTSILNYYDKNPKVYIDNNDRRVAPVKIDVERGWFAFPRPIYWTQCEQVYHDATVGNGSTDTLNVYPTIIQDPPVDMPCSVFKNKVLTNSIITEPGKLGNAIKFIYTGGEGNVNIQSAFIYPFGSDFNPLQNNELSSGTISMWINMHALHMDETGYPNNWSCSKLQIDIGDIFGNPASHISSLIRFGYDGTFDPNSDHPEGTIGFWNDYDASLGGYATLNKSLQDRWMHLYIVWDTNKGININNEYHSFVVYMDADVVLKISDIPSSHDYRSICFRFIQESEQHMEIEGLAPYVAFDNLKIWDHVVHPGPAWIYNYENTSGNDGALHEVYGQENDYQVDLFNGNNGIGYYFIPEKQ